VRQCKGNGDTTNKIRKYSSRDYSQLPHGIDYIYGTVDVLNLFWHIDWNWTDEKYKNKTILIIQPGIG